MVGGLKLRRTSAHVVMHYGETSLPFKIRPSKHCFIDIAIPTLMDGTIGQSPSLRPAGLLGRNTTKEWQWQVLANTRGSFRFPQRLSRRASSLQTYAKITLLAAKKNRKWRRPLTARSVVVSGEIPNLELRAVVVGHVLNIQGLRASLRAPSLVRPALVNGGSIMAPCAQTSISRSARAAWKQFPPQNHRLAGGFKQSYGAETEGVAKMVNV